MFYKKLLGIEGKKKSPYMDRFEIPMGTKLHFESYSDGKITKKDIVTIQVPRDNQFSALILAKQGYNKSTIMKRMMYYLDGMRFNIFYFDQKGSEIKWGSHHGSTTRLLPEEVPSTIPIKCYCPAFAYDDLPQELKAEKVFNRFSFAMQQFKSEQDLASLGFTTRGAQFIWRALHNNPHISLGELMDEAEEGIVSPSSKESVLGLLNYYSQLGLLTSATNDEFNLIKKWRDKEIPAVCVFTLDKKISSVLLGKIISEAYREEEDSRKMVFIDDAHIALSKQLEARNIGAHAINHQMLAIGRLKRWNAIIATQSPDILNDTTISLMDYKIIGKIGKLGETLKSSLREEIQEQLRTLEYKKEKHIFEYLLIEGDDYNYHRFYPAGPIIGHSYDPEARSGYY